MIRVLMFSFLSFLIISCDKDDQVISDTAIPESIIPLEVGNYWIYQLYTEQEDGSFTPKSSLDSVYISSTKIVDGNEFFVFESYTFGSQNALRDSSGYLINEAGNIKYSPKENEGILYVKELVMPNNDSITANYEMKSEEEIITPSGTYDSRSLKGSFDFSQSSDDCFKESNIYYADGIGVVRLDAFYVTDCRTVYRELLRYNIQ